MTAKYNVYEDDQGLFRFQLVAANGEVVADSQAYTSVTDVRAGMGAVQRAAAEAEVPATDADIVNTIHMHFVMRPPE